jgi:hypothetical protein
MELLIGVGIALSALILAYSQGLSRGRKEGETAANYKYAQRISARTLREPTCGDDEIHEAHDHYDRVFCPGVRTANQRVAEGDI